MKLHEYWLGLHPLDWEFCFMPVQTYKNFITEQYHKNPAFYNRPLAKLDKAIKIADTSNQGKAKCETASAVSIAFREDTKPFDKADSVFNKDTYLRDLAVIFALLFGQQMSLGTLFRQKRIGVYQGKTLVSGIRLQHRFCLDMDTRILE